ncbi:MULTISPECIES: hypothetical protein [Kordiimonas]|uniref:hypothetical protein n=1 Tax=Kordiimonas TaxID=288021 RepID=UPI00257E4C7A|nr:hypothetical protein [Kordiimonas sp. UBA4487]
MSLTVKSVTHKLLLMGAAGSLLAACGPTAVEPPQTQAPEPVVETEQIAPQEETLPAAPPPEPERLQGLNPREVVTLLGDPTLVRRDGPVQVMLFENHDCVLEVVFREPNQNEYFQAHYIAARNLDGKTADTQACLMKVLPNGNWPDK